jgi:hypothetical protein
MEDTMAEAYHNLKKLYIKACNKINMLEKEVKTLQGQLQEQYKVRQERYNENKNHYPDES